MRSFGGLPGYLFFNFYIDAQDGQDKKILFILSIDVIIKNIAICFS